MSIFTENGITFNNVTDPIITTGGNMFARGQYSKTGSQINLPQKVLNAIDIDWNNANVPGLPTPINNTSDLLKILGDIYENGGGHNNIPNIVILSPEEYEALTVKDQNTLYFITGDVNGGGSEEPEPEEDDPYSITTNLTINDTQYSEAETELYKTVDGSIIFKPGETYNLSGTLRGNIIIDATTEEAINDAEDKTLEYTNIVLNNLQILSDSDFGIMYKIPEGGKGFKGISITVEKNSFNSIICTQEFEESTDNQAGCIYSMNNLEIQGAGYLALKNNNGHGIRAKETTLTNLHCWVDVTHDGVHGKNIYIIGGTYYFENCNDCFGTSDNELNVQSGHILFFDGSIRYNYVAGQILDSKKQGIYFNDELLTSTELERCNNMDLISQESFRSYKEWGDNVATFTIKQYDSSSNYKNLVNGTPVEVTPVNIVSNDNKITCVGYNITSSTPLLSIVGYVDKPLYFNTGFGTNLDAEITLNNAFICNSSENCHTLYYDPTTEKGKLKIKAYNDSLNVILNTYQNNIEISYDCDCVKSENNVECEGNAGSFLYISSSTCDGIDASELKISDTKGTIIVSRCGQRGLKGNCIVIGPDAVISGGSVQRYVTDVNARNYKTTEGIIYVKNNCQLYKESNISYDSNATEEEIINQKTITGMADIFARNGKNASKGDFGTQRKELPGYLIMGSLGAIKRANLDNSPNIYYNRTYYCTFEPTTSQTKSINLINDPGAAEELYFAKNIFGTNIEYDSN